MLSLNKLLITTLCALSLSVIMGQDASAFDGWHHNNGHYRPHHPPVVFAPPRHAMPVYTQPHGVARPHRFVCGADVFTGHYNCVRKKKAHFVRPMYHAPAPRYYAPAPRHHGYHPGW